MRLMNPATFGPDLNLVSLTEAVFLDRCLAEGFEHIETTSWVLDADGEHLLDGCGLNLIFTLREPWSYEALAMVDSCPVSIELRGGSIFFRIAAPRERLDGVVVELQRVFPKREKPGEVEFAFWYWNANGGYPTEHARHLEVPHWDDLFGNYVGSAADSLDSLMHSVPERPGGQLMLWHGPPGTGKTYALRALAAAWAHKARFEFIADPESFLGQAEYMMHVLLREQNHRSKRDMWRVLILEDTGELLQPNARQLVGQGLSRLLNTVDGLIGQGLRTLVLITTNEEMSRLHPAVARPGRCKQVIEFNPFPTAEANRWLLQRGVEERVHDATALADLFAIVEGRSTRAPAQPVGFR